MPQTQYHVCSQARLTLPTWRLDHFILHIYGFFFMILFFSVADQALGHAGLLPMQATLLCAVFLGPYILWICLCSSNNGINGLTFPQVLFENRLAITSLVLIALVALLWSVAPAAYWAENGKWVAVIPYDISIALCSMALGVYPWRTNELRLVILTSLLALLGSLWFDMLHPGTFAELGNRAAGFPGNANFAALVAVVLCASGLDFGDNAPSSPRAGSLIINSLFLLASFLVVMITMSRSGMVNFLAVTIVYLYFRFVGASTPINTRLRELVILSGIASLATAFVIWLGALGASADSDSRLTRLLHNKQVDDGSAATRLAAVYDSIRLIEDSPWVGHGTGFARTMSELPHNLYLQQWVNNGIPGIVTYLFFLVVTFLTFYQRGYRNGQVLVLVAAVGSIFSHNVLDQRPFLILIGLFLSHSTINQRRRDTHVLLALHRNAPTRVAEPLVVLADRVNVR